jgi:hypothetical protein
MVRSVDVERVIEGVTYFHETWSSIFSVIVAAVVLWFQASWAMFPPIGVIVAFIIMTSAAGKVSCWHVLFDLTTLIQTSRQLEKPKDFG